eukprot:comp22219_c0_seq1/m.32723 comp22219_c0_seq1/g.32723  ORF comp22219_c0_seq1/g.32723 comp22219_c0_seq1/m.32723 type:complete len:290 (-) comp22219_c0_seq1:298-1167(-)
MFAPRWLPYHPLPAPVHNQLGLGVYAAPTEPEKTLKAKRAPRGAVPRTLQNRISAQRVRDRQKNYVKTLEETVARLEVENAKLFAEIGEIKKAYAHLLPEGTLVDVKAEPSTPPYVGSPLSTSSETDSCPSPSSAFTVSDSRSLSDDDLSVSNIEFDDDVLLGLPPLDDMAPSADLTAPAEPCNLDLTSWASVAGLGQDSGYSCESAALASPLQQETLFSFLMFSWAVLTASASMWTFFLLTTTGRGSRMFSKVTACKPEVAVRSARCAPLEGQCSKEWALALTAFKVS